MDIRLAERKAGRPRAIPAGLIPAVVRFYAAGMGYRAIARELEHEGICITYSTVRRVIKGHDKSGSEKTTSSVTIL